MAKQLEKLSAVSDEQIIAAILQTGSTKEAAEALGITAKTIYTRKTTDAFKALWYAAKADILRGATLNLNRTVARAVDTIAEIMNDQNTNPAVRLQAAGMILKNASELQRSLTGLEQQAATAFAEYHFIEDLEPTV